MKRRPVPTTIAGGSEVVNKWLLTWNDERQELIELEALCHAFLRAVEEGKPIDLATLERARKAIDQ